VAQNGNERRLARSHATAQNNGNAKLLVGALELARKAVE